MEIEPAIVPHLDAERGVEQKQPLLHIIERRPQQRGLLRELLLASLQRGDVGVNDDRAAVMRALLGNVEPAIADLPLLCLGVGRAMAGHSLAHPVLDPPFGGFRQPRGGSGADDLLEAGAGDEPLGERRVQLAIAAIAEHQPIRGIDEQKALRDGLDRRHELRLRRRRSLFRKHLFRQVAAGAAISDEAARAVENGHAAHHEMLDPVHGAADETEIAERRALVERAQQWPPVDFVETRQLHLVDALAEEMRGEGRGRPIDGARHISEAELGVLFPEPVGANLGESAEALLLGGGRQRHQISARGRRSRHSRQARAAFPWRRLNRRC